MSRHDGQTLARVPGVVGHDPSATLELGPGRNRPSAGAAHVHVPPVQQSTTAPGFGGAEARASRNTPPHSPTSSLRNVLPAADASELNPAASVAQLQSGGGTVHALPAVATTPPMSTAASAHTVTSSTAKVLFPKVTTPPVVDTSVRVACMWIQAVGRHRAVMCAHPS